MIANHLFTVWPEAYERLMPTRRFKMFSDICKSNLFVGLIITLVVYDPITAVFAPSGCLENQDIIERETTRCYGIWGFNDNPRGDESLLDLTQLENFCRNENKIDAVGCLTEIWDGCPVLEPQLGMIQELTERLCSDLDTLFKYRGCIEESRDILSDCVQTERETLRANLELVQGHEEETARWKNIYSKRIKTCVFQTMRWECNERVANVFNYITAAVFR